jgi:hypothetical protein
VVEKLAMNISFDRPFKLPIKHAKPVTQQRMLSKEDKRKYAGMSITLATQTAQPIKATPPMASSLVDISQEVLIRLALTAKQIHSKPAPNPKNSNT